MDQKQSTDHNSDADTDSIAHINTIAYRRNVVGALFEHFKKWHPEKLTNASSIKTESRSTETETGDKDASSIQEMRQTSEESR